MNFKNLVQNRLDSLTKPLKSLGYLEEIAMKLAIIQNKLLPQINGKGTLVFAADHGVVKHNVSAFPKEVTVQMVHNFLNNGAAINVFSNFVNSKVFIIDAGVDFDFKNNSGVICNKIRKSTGDLYLEKAMTKNEAIQNIELGKKITEQIIVKNKINLVALGEMGIGNTTPSSIIIGHICSIPTTKITGRGTGIDNKRFKIKKNVITSVLKRIENISDPYEILSETGGLEFAQITGAILACYKNNIAVVIDGLICTSAALLAFLIEPNITDIMFAGHKSYEPAHIYALNKLKLKPVLDLDMRLGEGTGAVLAMNIIEASSKMICEMATFESAGVSVT